MAKKIAGRAAEKCKPTDNSPGCTNVLLTDPNAQFEIVTAKGFEASVKALSDAYGGVAPGGLHENAVSDYLSAAGPLLTAIRSSATYTNQNFQPTTQSMITLLTYALHADGIALWTSTAPGNLDDGLNNVDSQIAGIGTAKTQAYSRVHDLPEAQQAAYISALGDIDKEFSAFRTSLTASSPDGTILATIVKGETLKVSLGTTGLLLTVSVDAAGGDTKTTHFFWQELFWPTPSPSYNGGAVVSFLLTDQDGNFKDAYMFHAMYDFSKWKSPKYVDAPYVPY